MAGNAAEQNDQMEPQEIKEFQPGDYAVYPVYGVVRVENVESREIDGQKKDFYIMHILESNMTIMTPTENVGTVGLRDVIPKKEVSKVYKVLKSKKDVANGRYPWNRRHREYMGKIKTGSVYEVAKVFRDLFRIKLRKSLAFGERKLFDSVQGLLVKELSVASKKDQEVIMSEIETLFKARKKA